MVRALADATLLAPLLSGAAPPSLSMTPATIERGHVVSIVVA